MNAKRMEKYSSLVTQCAECNRRVFPVVNTCLDNIVQGSAAVDPVKVGVRVRVYMWSGLIVCEGR